MKIKEIKGGVTAAQGFTANGIHCGIRKNKKKKDLALIVSEELANAASVYTLNLVQGAPIQVTKNNLITPKAKAIICNSGNANTCNLNGIQVAEQMCELTAQELDCDKNDIVVASTGVIGQELDVSPIAKALPNLVQGLGNKSEAAAKAIMTTDLTKKEIAVSFELDGVTCKIGGIAKGSGMIHPNMATMLVFITTDVAIEANLLQKALKNDCDTTFNMISVDGDTSTNDMVTILANGKADNPTIVKADDHYQIFCAALNYVTTFLCKAIAADGEGATKLLECQVSQAANHEQAKMVAKSVISSSLLKAAMFGEDANWGRVLCAIGYCGALVDVSKIGVAFASKAGEVEVCQNGMGIDFSEKKAKKILAEKEIQININLQAGRETARAWGCDLTYDYVKINGDYRT